MLTSDQTSPLFCSNHPTVETALRCGRCDTPICGRCAVPSELGSRCPTCGGRGTSIIYELSPMLLGRGLLLGLAVAAPIGLALGNWLYWSFWWTLLLGIGVGEAVARGANERRGPKLQAVAALCVLLAIGLAFWWNLRAMPGLSLADVAEAIERPFLRQLLGLTLANGLFTALALFLALRRVG